MLILIFDTSGGLCNQFYDIIYGVNFCLKYNINFTFRNCSFRNDNLVTWYNQPFEKLFDLKLFDKYNLYINYYEIKDDLTNENCFNLDGEIYSFIYFDRNSNIFEQLNNLNKKYIVLKQFWSLYNSNHIIDNDIPRYILPSKHLTEKYNEILNSIKEPYNFIHYRYESDFKNYFKLEIMTLDDIIKKINFKNNTLKIYIATSNIKNLLNFNENSYSNLLFKNDDLLIDFNFEELAFIDYMIGLNSVECFGHNNSSFSCMINNLKGSNNYYNLL